MKLCAESCKQLPPTAELPFGKEYRGAEDFPLTSLVAKAFIKKPYKVLLGTLAAAARSITIAASVTGPKTLAKPFTLKSQLLRLSYLLETHKRALLTTTRNYYLSSFTPVRTSEPQRLHFYNLSLSAFCFLHRRFPTLIIFLTVICLLF